jgi:predicted transcriptional regulator
MPKQTTVRLPDDLADKAKAVARVRDDSANQLVIDSLAARIDRVRTDHRQRQETARTRPGPTCEVIRDPLSGPRNRANPLWVAPLVAPPTPTHRA